MHGWRSRSATLHNPYVTAVEVLRLEAEMAFAEVLTTIEGIDEPLSWAVVPLKEGEYLHDNASILGMVQHLAECKIGYGSSAFRNMEIRGRDIADRLEEIGSSWEKSKAYLMEAHEYWMSSWSADTDILEERMHCRGDMWPTWKIIAIMTTHDMYHAGQIEILKSSLSPTSVPPESMAELNRKYASDSANW
jgi:hypothetical protein